jgi:hypothetical protein
MPKTALSYPDNKMLKLILIAYFLIMTYTSPISKLIIPFL